jgi:hypothetical protein
MIRSSVASRDLPQRRGVRTPSFPHAFSGNPGEDRKWTPDPFDVAQGRGEHSRTTIKTFGDDDFGPLRGEYS